MTIAQDMEKVAGSVGFVGVRKSVRTIWHSRNRESSSNDVYCRSSFTRAELESCSTGSLFGPGSAQLPSSPLLMLDRIIDIRSSGGHFDRGYAIAELDIDPSHWYFRHHFHGDPVMPGCFLIESLWQLAGFHMAWSGHRGRGRILDSGRSRFIESVEKDKKTITISIEVRKLLGRDNPICIANGEVSLNHLLICKSDAIKVGLFNE